MNVILGHPTSLHMVFVGPYGVGKTTALRAISDIPVVETEERSLREMTQASDSDKTSTTVGFDFGERQLADGVRLALVGVPGQERFQAMWDAFLPQSSAVVLWLYGNRSSAITDCRFWLEALAQRRAVTRFVVALTRVPSHVPDAAFEPFRREIARYHPFAPLITADPRDADSVMQVVTAALSTPYSPLQTS